jgi:hypothetical protein
MRWKDRADRLGEGKWQNIEWNYKPTDRKERGKTNRIEDGNRTLRPVQASSWLTCENKGNELTLIFIWNIILQILW